MYRDMDAPTTPLAEINAPRLMESLFRLSSIGQEADGSITRLAFTPEYSQIVDQPSA